MAREIIGEKDGIQFFVGQDAPQTTTNTQTATMTPRVPSGTSQVSSPVVAPNTGPSFGVAQPSATPPRTRDLTATSTPILPTPSAPSAMAEYTQSSVNSLESERKRLEDAYKKQLSETHNQIKAAEAKQAQFTQKQEGVLKQVEPLNQPFRNQLETGERQRLFINENFEANQKLIGELDTLLTQSSNMMQQLRSTKIPGLAAISQSPRALQAMQDVSARVGVIQAVISARNGQIAQGQNFIDRSMAAINADRQDQLNYYKTVYDFYENQKDEEGKKLYQLNQEEKGWINKQIGLLESDLNRSQRTADYIKELMISPDTAQYMADAGVTLNDSVETIQQKMARQSKIEMRKKQAEVNRKELFDAGIRTPFANRNGEIIRVADGYSFDSPEEFMKFTGMTLEEAQAQGLISDYNADTLMNRNQVMALAEKYWDAGITAADTLASATQKALRSSFFQKSVSSGGSGRGGSDLSSEVQQYASDVMTGKLKLSSVPQKIRAQVSAEVDRMKGNESAKYDSEFEARLDYDTVISQVYSELAAGKSLTSTPTEMVANLTNRFGKYVSPQEIEGAVLDIVGKKKPEESSASPSQQMVQSPSAYQPQGYNNSFFGAIGRNLGEFKDMLLGRY